MQRGSMGRTGGRHPKTIIKIMFLRSAGPWAGGKHMTTGRFSHG